MIMFVIVCARPRTPRCGPPATGWSVRPHHNNNNNDNESANYNDNNDNNTDNDYNHNNDNNNASIKHNIVTIIIIIK